MFPSVRLHDAVDAETVLRRLLPVLAGNRERRVAYASFDRERGLLTRRWTVLESGEVEAGTLELEPERVHALLLDDAGGDRPLRPADSAAVWVLRDLVHGLEPERVWVKVRAIAHDGALLGVLLVAEPRRFMLGQRDEGPAAAAGDVLEMALARAISLAAARARAELERGAARVDALESATANATELLMEAHVELDRRAMKHQRQTRVLFLLRRLLERSAAGLEPRELAVEIVRTVAEAFGGGRCSLLLVDERSGEADLRLGAAIGLPPQVQAGEVRVRGGGGISAEVARTRTLRVVRDTGEGEGSAMLGDDWYTSDAFVSLPLVCRGRLLGVLNLTNFRAGTVDDAEVEQLRLASLCVALLADHAGLAGELFHP